MSDKELAVEILCSYIGARFTNPEVRRLPDGETLKSMLLDCYDAVCAIKEETQEAYCTAK